MHDGVALPNTAVPGGWATVASNTQTPTNPRGNAVTGDYEMVFTAEGNFSFPGGNLAIRFSNPSATYQTDNDCDQVLVRGDSADTSGYFFGRAWNDADGLPAWTSYDEDSIGAIRIVAGQGAPRIPVAGRLGTVVLIALLAVCGLVAVRLRLAA